MFPDNNSFDERARGAVARLGQWRIERQISRNP
jgi:hypothetical protein